MQYLEALRVLKAQGVKLQRTIHLTFVPGSFVSMAMLPRSVCGTKQLQGLISTRHLSIPKTRKSAATTAWRSLSRTRSSRN
jgi:hypothetical protein